MELLNCYYAHAAENTKFQRRCYWLLNSDEGVVLVHFLLVTAKAAAEAAAAAGKTAAEKELAFASPGLFSNADPERMRMAIAAARTESAFRR